MTPLVTADTSRKKHFKIVLEYDGTPYFGWQIQPGRPTIQGELQAALSTILNQRISLTGSGRTDAGVHALGQTAHFSAMTAMDGPDLKHRINRFLKGPITVRTLEAISSDFHARFHALSKTYCYHILNRAEPPAVGRDYIWHIPCSLDVAAMNRCCRTLVGAHDFKSFEASGSPRAHTVRTIYQAAFAPGTPGEKQLIFTIRGNGFLRYMVRNIVGTLVEVGRSRLTSAEFQAILAARDRQKAAATAPARGLFLMQVAYPAPWDGASPESPGCNG